MSRPGPTLSTAMIDAAVELIGRSGYLGSVEVQGVSMHPTFDGVGRLAVEFSPGDLGFGDVVVFRQRDTLVVHRLVQRSRKNGQLRLRTRGDGKIGFDPWVDPDAIIGRVVALGYPDGSWRSVRRFGARFYAMALGLHHLCWGGLGAVLLKIGGSRGPDWHWRLGRIDLFKLKLVHAVLFRVFNRRAPAPRFDGVASGDTGVEARCYTRRPGQPHGKNPTK